MEADTEIQFYMTISIKILKKNQKNKIKSMDSSEMGKYIIAITILFSLLLKYQCEVIVAQDGSGNFKRINDAIRAAPINS